jgi:hypothetical protein
MTAMAVVLNAGAMEGPWKSTGKRPWLAQNPAAHAKALATIQVRI